LTIQKTEKLYLDDPYNTKFRATVISTTPGADNTFDVVLDSSAFYPESGGQLPDSGMLGGCEVIDVRELDDDVVVHCVRGEHPPGDQVEGVVDWDTRFDHMQQHTGQHVLSRAFIETGALHTVSFHMGDDTCTIDVEGEFVENSASRAEELANRIVEKNLRVVVSTVPVDRLVEMDLRRKVPDGITVARLVEVSGFDTIPCCGTHVGATGELGLIKVLKQERVKKKTRVYFKVGRRAVKDYRAKHDIVSAVAGRLTTSAGEIAGAVDQMFDDVQASRKRVQRVSMRLATIQARQLREAAARRGDRAIVAQWDPEWDLDYARLLSSALKELSATVALIAANDGTVVCSASSDVDIDFPAVAMAVVKEAGGSGGGKGAFAQFKFPDDADVGALLKKVEQNVTKHL